MSLGAGGMTMVDGTEKWENEGGKLFSRSRTNDKTVVEMRNKGTNHNTCCDAKSEKVHIFFLPSLSGISKCCLSCKIADLKCIPLSVSIYLCSRKRHSPFNFPFAFFLAFSRHFYLQIFDISYSFSTANTQLTFSLAPIILSCQNGMQLPCRGTTESHIS